MYRIKNSYLAAKKMFIKTLPITLPLMLAFLVITTTAIGCAWFSSDHTVHFNDGRSWRQFGFLPPLPKNYSSENNTKDRPWNSGEAYDYETGSYTNKEQKNFEDRWREAIELADHTDINQKTKLLEKYLELTKNDAKSYASKRSTAIDLLDALTALKQGSSVDSVEAYFATRVDFYRKANPENPNNYSNTAQKTENTITSEQLSARLAEIKDKNLQDNVEYLQAAILYQEADYIAAEQKFNQLASLYPNSEKHEAALYMAALCAMKQSSINANLPEKEEYTWSAPTPKDCPECKDQAWKTAHKRFSALLEKYPNGRYREDARGWLAHLDNRVGDHVNALVTYYTMLADKDAPNSQYEAAVSLSLVRHHASEKEMRQVETQLANKPKVALAYAYYEIYNYPTHVCYIPDLEDSVYFQKNPSCINKNKDEDENEPYSRRPKEVSFNGYEKVAKFAQKMIDRASNSEIDGAFVLRVAMAKLQMGDDSAAISLAQRALDLGLKDEELHRALLVKGVAEYHTNDYNASHVSFARLIELNPKGRLMVAARKNLAIAAENANDLDTALTQYIALDYQLDVAYLIDVIMSSEQLAKFITENPKSPQHDELVYALGIRYMREDKLQLAREAFSQVHTISKSIDEHYGSTHNVNPSEGEKQKTNPKEMEFDSIDWSVPGVRQEWLIWDLATLNGLEELEQEVAYSQNRDDEIKAEALYKLASFIYDRGSLTYYNPLAWRGQQRWFNFSILNSSGEDRLKNEAALVWKHFQQHENLSQAINIYLEVCEKYPKTRAAKDSLYSAAVAHEKLSNYNPYWRDIYQKGLFAGKRKVDYADVRLTYPNYVMPIGTYGWHPSTRTVGSHPAWTTPPADLNPKPAWQKKLNHFTHRLAAIERYSQRKMLAIGYYFLIIQVLGALVVISFLVLKIKRVEKSDKPFIVSIFRKQ